VSSGSRDSMRTYMTKSIAAFRNFANVPNNGSRTIWHHVIQFIMIDNHKVEWGYKQQVSRVPRGIHVNRIGQNVCATLKQPRINWKWRSNTSLRNNPEECSSHLLRGGSLKSHPLRKIHQVYFRMSLRYHICKFDTFHTEHVRTSSTYIPNINKSGSNSSSKDGNRVES